MSHVLCLYSLRILYCFFSVDVEEFLSKKTELNYSHLKRQHEHYVSSGHLPVIPQVHNQ